MLDPYWAKREFARLRKKLEEVETNLKEKDKTIKDLETKIAFLTLKLSKLG